MVCLGLRRGPTFLATHCYLGRKLLDAAGALGKSLKHFSNPSCYCYCANTCKTSLLFRGVKERRMPIWFASYNMYKFTHSSSYQIPAYTLWYSNWVRWGPRGNTYIHLYFFCVVCPFRVPPKKLGEHVKLLVYNMGEMVLQIILHCFMCINLREFCDFWLLKVASPIEKGGSLRI